MDINVIFSRKLLTAVMVDIKKLTSVVERKEAWVYDFGGDHWEFHGPDRYYWHGAADNAYDAKAKGWSAWLRDLELNGSNHRARVLGEEQRVTAALKMAKGE